MQAVDVFTPNTFPAHTYIPRDEDFEGQVGNGLRTTNIVVSISGPSKSGKSVLLQRVVGKDNLIRLFGPQIRSPEDLWDATFDWMGSPTSNVSQVTSGTARSTTGGGSVSFGLPSVVGMSGTSQLANSEATGSSQTSSHSRAGLAGVAREIANSDFVLFIDDFHYISRQEQSEVAKNLKAAAELGIKVCVASVPHRSDDVVRANSELRGRLQSIDMGYWNVNELSKIGAEGFKILNMQMPPSFIDRLAIEACGSPQLMQALCLQTCYRFDVYLKREAPIVFVPTDDDISKIQQTTSSLSDFSTLLENMHEGPKLRGQDRKQYEFNDGTEGDVYRAVLLAIAADPPIMSITYKQLMARVAATCLSEPPVGSSVSEACSQIDKIAGKSVETDTGVQGYKPVEWDNNGDVENLHIVEPYFLFYLRSSLKLRKLGRAQKLALENTDPKVERCSEHRTNLTT